MEKNQRLRGLFFEHITNCAQRETIIVYFTDFSNLLNTSSGLVAKCYHAGKYSFQNYNQTEPYNIITPLKAY